MNQNKEDNPNDMFKTLLVVTAVVFIAGAIIGAAITLLIQK